MQAKTTIFKQLVVSIVIPVTLVLITLGFLNYYNINKILKESNKKRNQIISNEVQNILSIQDYTLLIIEKQLDARVEKLSNMLQKEKFADSKNCLYADLFYIREELDMDSLQEDIYIIDASTGKIVNTTFPKDKNINVYSFGKDFRLFLEKVIREKKFVSERFSIETSTNRIKKYTYQPTLDGKYIIETGLYSADADSTKKIINQLFQNIKQQDSSIYHIELFIGADDPFGFNTGNRFVKTDIRRPYLLEAFRTKKNITFDFKDNDYGHIYDFIFMERKNTLLYRNSVIMVVTDKSNDFILLRNELIKQILLFGVTVLLVIGLIYFITHKIVMPLKKLLNNVIRISDGNFSERMEVKGNNEIAVLSDKFNEMLTTVEGYYMALEEKVYLRTEENVKQKNQYKKLLQLNQDILIRDQEIKLQKEEIEQKKSEIMDSITYAQRIQSASLPMQVFLDFVFSEYFILFEPKDIVSGDFYWAYKIEEYTLFAVGDCTGHGVPGSFLTILGIAFLNEIAASTTYPDPAIILDKLRLKIIKSLHQTDKNSILADGMDIAICVINENTQELHFAGANSPVYILREEQEQNSDSNSTNLFELKGDKMPIGGFHMTNIPFSIQTLQLKEKDMIYIFSDGIKDQIGGPNNKKYNTTQFKSLLTQIYCLPVDEQCEMLRNNVTNWRSNMVNNNINHVQTDDICVMGVRFLFEQVPPYKISTKDYNWEL